MHASRYISVNAILEESCKNIIDTSKRVHEFVIKIFLNKTIR